MCIRLHAEVCVGGGDAASNELSCIYCFRFTSSPSLSFLKLFYL